jgi:hypothetical protein
MNCDNCDCANQPVLIPVRVPKSMDPRTERVYWGSANWCVGCLLETRPDLVPETEETDAMK